MHIIKPHPIFWFATGTGPDGLTLTLTTNPQPKDFFDEMTGLEAQIVRRLNKFNYFELAISDKEDLEHLIELASAVLKGKSHAA